MKVLRTRLTPVFTCLAVVIALVAAPSAAAQTGSTVLNFDSASTGDASSYFTGFGISITGVSGTGSPSIQAVPSWINSASAPNALVGPGGAAATSYTLVLPSAVTSISFSRLGPNAATSVAGWTATGLNSSGGTVASAGEGQTCCTAPTQTFTVSGAGMMSLRISSNGCQCGIQSPWLDNLTFSPAFPAAGGGNTSVAGSAAITGGALSMGTLAGISFSGTLSGLNQVFSSPTNGVTVTDATGSGSGWNLTVSGTEFTTGGTTPRTLPATALQVTGLTSVSAANSSGVNPTNAVAYPLTVPLAAPPATATATKFFNSSANTGMGAFSLNSAYSLSIPANTFSGNYTSTLTISLVSGP